LEEAGLDERIILKTILKNWNICIVLIGSGYGKYWKVIKADRKQLRICLFL